MLNISFLVFTKMELKEVTVCIVLKCFNYANHASARFLEENK